MIICKSIKQQVLGSWDQTNWKESLQGWTWCRVRCWGWYKQLISALSVTVQGIQDLQSTMVKLPRCWRWSGYRLLHDYHWSEVLITGLILLCAQQNRTFIRTEEVILLEQGKSFSPMEISEIEFSNVPQCVLVGGKYFMCILWEIKNGKWTIIDPFAVSCKGHFALCNHSLFCSLWNSLFAVL